MAQDDFSTLAALRARADELLAARDAIENMHSPEWRAANKVAGEAALAERAERRRLARDPATRYGSWRRPVDEELMLRGYL